MHIVSKPERNMEQPETMIVEVDGRRWKYSGPTTAPGVSSARFFAYREKEYLGDGAEWL